MRSQRIRLKLTKEQERLAWWYNKVTRRYWNLLVDIDKRNNQGEFDEILSERRCKTYHSNLYNRDVYSLGQSDYMYLGKIVAAKNYDDDSENWSWYYQPNQSFIYAYTSKELVRVRRENKGRLNFRSADKTRPNVPVRCAALDSGSQPSRIYLKDSGKLQIPSLGEVRFGSVKEGANPSCAKKNAKISYDGKYWYLTYSEEVESQVANQSEYTDGVGVDLGITTLATMSDGTTVPNIRMFRRVRILNKRLKRLQRKLSRKYHINKCNKHNKTKNIIKLERQIKLIYRSIKNIRINHIRKFVSDLVKKQPRYIAIEDLDVSRMMKNKYIAGDVVNCSFYTIREHLIRKATEHHITVRLVDRYYPSSKTCSNCGSYKADLTHRQRVYRCNHCHIKIDRDFNASLNIAKTDQYTLA